MMPLPPRDTHAEALAATIYSLTTEAWREVRDFAEHGDYRGAHNREDMLREEIFKVCVEFNKAEAAHRRVLEGEIQYLYMTIPSRPTILVPAPENE